jgi:hypothetical protein
MSCDKKIFKNYENLGFVVIGINLKMNKEGKKEMKPPSEWQLITKTTIDKKHNAVMIRNKTKLSDGSYLYIIDLDNKQDVEGITGIDYFRNYCRETKTHFKTFTQITGNNGIHYYFRTFNTDLINNGPIVGLEVDGIKRQIDIVNGLISEPSQYGTGDNIKKYEFRYITDNINDIALLPPAIEDLILNHKTKKEVKEDKKPNYTKLIKQTFEPNYKLLDELEDEFHSGYERWRNMAFFMKNLNYTSDDFIRMSMGKDFISESECLKMWNNTKLKDDITEAYLYARLKETKPEVFSSLKFKFDFPITKFINDDDIIKMSQRRLINLETNSNLDDMNDPLTFNVNKFFKSDIKSLSIKSPYDTGKTTLIEKIFKKYEPKKILWLSYRKTLTNDILGSFAENYNFKGYQSKDYSADRLIIQLESLNKLKPHMMFCDDEYDIPSYDLVIIDEVESILNHFNHMTFKGKERDTFNWMVEIIKVSKKMIVLDGDIDDRTYNFLNHFGPSINIVNDIKINKKSFIIMTNKEVYYKKIIHDIQYNKKVVIVSMSSTQCDKIMEDENFKVAFTNKKVLVYTGSSGDNTKDDLKDVKTNWADCDVLIYSPTIESGVNFDMEHFDSIYGIICENSTTQRAFCQMLSRVRKIKEKNIWVLNMNYKLDVNEIDDNNKYYYDEVKNLLINLNVVEMKEVINNGKIKKELDFYDSNYIFNKIESLYKNNYYFLGHLKKILISKGHSFQLDMTTYKEQKKKKDDDDKEKIEDILLSVDDINSLEYEKLLIIQAECQATELDKLKIKKYVFKKSLGVDILNQELIDNYEFSTIKKYIGLIDSDNIQKTTSNYYKEEIKRIEIVQSLINDLGFKNMYDRKTTLNNDEFTSRISQLETFKDDKGLRILFNCRSIQNNFDSIKSFMGCCNSMLQPYSIKIKSIRKKVDGKEQYDYGLSYIKGREYIDELLQYRINKGLKIKCDIRSFTPTDYYKDLIKVKPITDDNDDEDEKVYFPKRD